jgi:hypothetical protein
MMPEEDVSSAISDFLSGLGTKKIYKCPGCNEILKMIGAETGWCGNCKKNMVVK